MEDKQSRPPLSHSISLSKVHILRSLSALHMVCPGLHNENLSCGSYGGEQKFIFLKKKKKQSGKQSDTSNNGPDTETPRIIID